MQAEIAKEAFITKDLERIKTCLETNMRYPAHLMLDVRCVFVSVCLCVCARSQEL